MPTSHVRDPGRLAEHAAAVREGRVSPVTLLERYLARIDEVEPSVQAWRLVDRDGAHRIAADREAEARAGRIRGPLHGIPVAIKDVIDVEGLPTRANSRSRETIPPATSDAEIVSALRAAGAVIMGKVHTTEFAFFDPSPARNPHNLAHTPGGSSSGSAAAVAAGMAPMAIGTQTVASVNRPAAYCGISAFKPSTRSLTAHGITPLAPSYDTPGFYGWSAADAIHAWQAVAPNFLPAGAAVQGGRVLRVEDPHLDAMVPEMREALDRMAANLAGAGLEVTRVPSRFSFERLFEIQRSTMLYEAGRAMKAFLDLPAGQVGDKLLEAIRHGLTIPTARYLDERGEIDRMRRTHFGADHPGDIYLWPAAPGPAPEGLAWTGDPRFISPWTALGGPMLTVPAGATATGLPLGCLLMAAPGQDHRLAAMGLRLAPAIERHPIAGD